MSAHQEARINKRRRVSAGESSEWLSYLLHLRFVSCLMWIFECKSWIYISHMISIDLGPLLSVPRECFGMFLSCFMLFWCFMRNFWKISRFCQFLQSVTDIWATEACASTERRASEFYSGLRLCAPLAEAGASLERRGASVHARAPLSQIFASSE